MEKLQETFDVFADYLVTRFEKKIHTTEDSIRYTFFHSLLEKLDLKPDEIILEHPHPIIDNAELDMLVLPNNNRKRWIFEFKFNRKNPGGKSQPRPRHAGKLFADMARLVKCKDDKTRTFLVYVTDSEMADYLQNDSNKLDDFFNLPQSEILNIDKAYIGNHSKTFRLEANIYGEYPLKISSLYGKDSEKMFLRVYEIMG